MTGNIVQAQQAEMEGGVKDDNDGIGDAQGVGLFYANRLRLVGLWFNAS